MTVHFHTKCQVVNRMHTILHNFWSVDDRQKFAIDHIYIGNGILQDRNVKFPVGLYEVTPSGQFYISFIKCWLKFVALSESSLKIFKFKLRRIQVTRWTVMRDRQLCNRKQPAVNMRASCNRCFRRPLPVTNSLNWNFEKIMLAVPCSMHNALNPSSNLKIKK